MCEPNEDCYKPVGTVETQYPKEKCVGCNEADPCPEPTALSYTPQACIKVKNGILFSCSATVGGCEKTVKIYNGENEVVFQGSYTAANEFISTQNDGVVLLAVEFILCPEDSQTESNPVCFEVYTESDEKFIRESCDCCNSDMRVSDSYVATSCEECAVINFEPLFDGRHDIDEVVISETNPVANGTLSAIGGSKYLFKFCPADGFSGTTDFGFTIKDTKGNVSTEKTVYVEVKECPEPEVPCSETTVSVQIIDVNTDIPITALSYPIGVFSPFSTSSGTGGKIGDAASYAEIISLLNDDTNKPEDIVFSADGTGPNINVTGVCSFSQIKAGEKYFPKTKNGISGNGDTGNEIKLGGSLIEDTEIDADGNDFEIINSGLCSQRSGGASSIGTAAKRESIHEVQNFNSPNGYAIHYDRTVSKVTSYSLANGKAMANKSNSHLFVLKSNITATQLLDGSAVSNVIDAMQIDSDGGDYSLLQKQTSGRRVVSNRRVQTLLHPKGANKATIEKYANLELVCTAESSNNTWSEFIQCFVRSAKGTGALQASSVEMPDTYGIFQEDSDDKNVFYGEIEYHGALTNASDIRSKDILGAYEAGLEQVKSLNPILFTKKDGFGKQGVTFAGVVAQELEQVIPQAVSTGKTETMNGVVIEDFKTVDTSYIIFSLVNAVKELSAKCDFLQEQLDAK